MQSCLYEGIVRHRRRRPTPHDFRYRVFLVSLDLAELETVFAGRWFWSTRHWAPARFCRADYFGDPALPLDQAVRQAIADKLGEAPPGPIRLLTNLRYWGYVFNPISVYYCYQADGRRLHSLFTEVSNTPWNERHVYIHDARGAPADATLSFYNCKEFHVSPFMQMDQSYHWRVQPPAETLALHIASRDSVGPLFHASLNLKRREIATGSLASTLLRFPSMTAKAIAAIYWQAARLWWKRIPFVPHPGAKRPVLESLKA